MCNNMMNDANGYPKYKIMVCNARPGSVSRLYVKHHWKRHCFPKLLSAGPGANAIYFAIMETDRYPLLVIWRRAGAIFAIYHEILR